MRFRNSPIQNVLVVYESVSGVKVLDKDGFEGNASFEGGFASNSECAKFIELMLARDFHLQIKMDATAKTATVFRSKPVSEEDHL